MLPTTYAHCVMDIPAWLNMCENSWNTDRLTNHHGTLLCTVFNWHACYCVIFHFNSVCQCPGGPVLHEMGSTWLAMWALKYALLVTYMSDVSKHNFKLPAVTKRLVHCACLDDVQSSTEKRK